MKTKIPSLITKPTDITNHEYTVITTSEKGKHICMGCDFDQWQTSPTWSDLLIHHCINPINALLAPNDTIKTVLLVNNQAIQGINNLDKVLTLDDDLLSSANQPTLNYTPYHHEFGCLYNWENPSIPPTPCPTLPISDHEQLIRHPSEPLAQIKFGDYQLGDMLVTRCMTNTEGEQWYSVFVGDGSQCLSELNTIKPDNLNIIHWIAISENRDRNHLDIAKTALNHRVHVSSSQTVTQAQINAFLNQQATNAPPNPLQGQNGAIREQNKAINANNNPQTGNTTLNALIFLLALIILCLPFTCAMAYTKDLSKISLAVMPNRHSLAFFVSDICLDSQSSKGLNTNIFPSSRGKTIISKISNLSTAYDGLTLQNTIANRRICRAVSSDTESKTHHPMTFHSVVLTQKLLGGNHA